MIKVYFKTQDYDNDRKVYGYQLYVNDILSETYIGIMKGTDEEVTNNITKTMMKKNESLFNYDKLVYLKYQNLDMTKQMKWNIDYESFYQPYRNNGVVLSCNPSVFLSDNQSNHTLIKAMNNYRLKYNYFAKEQKKRG